ESHPQITEICGWHFTLEHVTHADDDAPGASVSSPLVEEVSGRNCRVGDTEVSRVGEVVEVSAELQALVLTDPRILQQSEIDVVDSIGPQDISSRVTDSLHARSGKSSEQRSSTRAHDFFNGHRRKIERRVQVRPDRIADQR